MFFKCISVSRLFCESESFKMDLILDVNTLIYPVELGKLALCHVLVATVSTVVIAPTTAIVKCKEG